CAAHPAAGHGGPEPTQQEVPGARRGTGPTRPQPQPAHGQAAVVAARARPCSRSDMPSRRQVAQLTLDWLSSWHLLSRSAEDSLTITSREADARAPGDQCYAEADASRCYTG
ncbi:hypothetical protein HaLaN_16391, partial [Haematococcus lacustris]